MSTQAGRGRYVLDMSVIRPVYVRDVKVCPCTPAGPGLWRDRERQRERGGESPPNRDTRGELTRPTPGPTVGGQWFELRAPLDRPSQAPQGIVLGSLGARRVDLLIARAII